MLHLSIKEVQRQLKNQNVSVTSLLKQTLQRIDTIKDLNAFVTVLDEDRIINEYESKKDKKECHTLVLEGATVAVKDNFCLSGTRTSCASRALCQSKDFFLILGRVQRLYREIMWRYRIDSC